MNRLLTERYIPPASASEIPLQTLADLRKTRDLILRATFAEYAAAATDWPVHEVPQQVWANTLSEVRLYRNALLKQSHAQREVFVELEVSHALNPISTSHNTLLQDGILSAKCSSLATCYPVGASYEICDLRRSLRVFEDVERYCASIEEVCARAIGRYLISC